MSELRVKSEYISHDKIRASMGCKIDASGLDDAVPGSPLFVIGPDDDEETIEGYEDEVMKSLSSLHAKIDKAGEGVCVQTSTLGAMEALLDFLADHKIPVSAIRIGPVHRRDVITASVMLERKKEFAVILAFDVVVTKEAKTEADSLGVRIFESEVIYQLTDMFQKYLENVRSLDTKFETNLQFSYIVKPRRRQKISLSSLASLPSSLSTSSTRGPLLSSEFTSMREY